MDSVAHMRYVVSSADLFIYLSYTELISGREHGGRLWVRRCVCLYPLPSGIGSRKSGPSRVVTDDDHRKIERWQAGESVPTINQLSQFSKKLRILVGYFFLDHPIDDVPPVFAHHTISNAAITEPSRELADTLTDMQSIQEWMCQDIVECGEGRLPFVGSYQVEQTTAVELANDIRHVLQLPVEWYHQG